MVLRECSSVGRASHLHCEGRGFETCHFHNYKCPQGPACGKSKKRKMNRSNELRLTVET